MGDHRASIKIEFSMYGETKKADWWINWSPNSDYQGIDQRVLDFFVAAYEEMSSVYYEEMAKAQEAEMRIREEQHERREYERLRKKFKGENT